MDYDTAQEAMKELTNLALTCQEMNQLVLEIALPALEEKLDKYCWDRFDIASTEDGKLPAYWTKILRNPMSCKIPELQVIFTANLEYTAYKLPFAPASN